MKLKRNCVFFNANINETGATPDWEHTLGQGQPLYLLKEDGCSEILNGLSYNLKSKENFRYGTGGSNYDIQIVSVFENVEIKIYDSELKTLSNHLINKPLIIILVKQINGTHEGRRFLKISQGFTYNEIKNSDFYGAINEIVSNPWFGYEINYDNLFTGILTFTIIKAPILYPNPENRNIRYPTKENRKAIWDNLANEYVEKFEIDKVNKNKFNKHHIEKNIQKIFYGAPGTGKSYKVDQVIKELNTKFYERITFHPEFDHATFVGGYKPVSDKDGGISYKFVPQAFTNIYERAWLDQENQYYLVIEEINRGNCAEIFGDIFQLLDRTSDYTVSPSEELKKHLIEKFGNDKNHDGIVKGLKLPPNLTIYATMNTSDQSLFPMDSAFKRRWEWEYVPINYEALNENGEPNDSFHYKVFLDDEKVKYFKWIDFIKNVNLKIEANENLGMDKCIGNYFIKSETKEISLHEFINKVIFYLWNDVFKDEDVSKSIFEKGISFEKFFPINKNALPLIEKILAKINVEILPKAE